MQFSFMAGKSTAVRLQEENLQNQPMSCITNLKIGSTNPRAFFEMLFNALGPAI